MNPWAHPTSSKSPVSIHRQGMISHFCHCHLTKCVICHSENDLRVLFSSLVPIKEIRMVMDKFTNAPRGFAFVHFFSVADASRAMNTFQVSAVLRRSEKSQMRRDTRQIHSERPSNCSMQRIAFHPWLWARQRQPQPSKQLRPCSSTMHHGSRRNSTNLPQK